MSIFTKEKDIIQELLEKVKDIIGIDVGFSTINVYSSKKKFKIPTVVSDGEKRTSHRNINTFEDHLDELHVIYKGEEKFVGNLAIRKRTGNLSWDENRLNGQTKIAFLTALALAIENFGERIKVVTGLPESRMKNEELVKSYENDLLGEHKITLIVEGKEVEKYFVIESVSVHGQAQGAYFNRAITDDFKLDRNYLLGKIGVIDPGMKTLDFSIIEKMDVIDNGSRDLGIIWAINKLLNYLQEKYDMNHLKTEDMLETMENGEIEIAGETINIIKLKNRVLKAQTERIESALANIWGTFKLFKEIILVGGAAQDMYHFFKNEYGNIVVDDDPQYSIVRGLWKYEAFKQLKKVS